MPIPETPILDDSAVSEIEAACEALKGMTDACDITHAKPEFVDYVLKCSPANVSALCATVKHLRWQVDLCEKAFELEGALKLSEVGDLNALQIVRKMVDLQSQLEQLRAENGKLQEKLERKSRELISLKGRCHE